MFAYYDAIPRLSDHAFRNIIANLGPGVLRVGGITCNFINYVIPQNEQEKRSIMQYWPNFEKDLNITGF